VGSAAVFISFGAGKFLNHASETASFRTYGLPWPGAFAGVIGVVELVGGALLLAGVATRLAAVVLAGDMIGAIITSGILHGESISLTLAPVMLGAMVVLAALGSGPLAGPCQEPRRPRRAGGWRDPTSRFFGRFTGFLRSTSPRTENPGAFWKGRRGNASSRKQPLDRS